MKFRFVLVDPEDEEGSAPSTEPPTKGQSPRSIKYEQSVLGMVRVQRAECRSRVIPLTNFNARIVADRIVDDGDEEHREFELEVELGKQTLAFTVSAAEFPRMAWVAVKVGPQAIVYPGQQQHARAAIQSLSGEIHQERIFAHLGWKKDGSRWLYLHGGGALDAGGITTGIQVQAPTALRSYRLASPNWAELVKAVRASLGCLAVAPDRISLPLLAAVYRAPFGRADFSMFISGKTGVFKSTVAALCQQHFGAAMNATHLPANFASTAGALQWLAFHAKDSLMVVDDFAPTGRTTDNALESVSESLFRSAGNQQPRHRMNGANRLNVPKPPRALILATGERIPRGQSIRARQLILQVKSGDVCRSRLGKCQQAGHNGQLAAAMGAFVIWIAGRFEELQDHLQTRVAELRAHYYEHAAHARIASAQAELLSAWEIFLRFAREVSAIDEPGRRRLEQRGNKALQELNLSQHKFQATGDPAMRFMALLRAALASGHAHVADREGNVPEDPSRWGWRCRSSHGKWFPHGDRIGWVQGADLFLEPAKSYRTAQQMAVGDSLVVSEQTLRHHLREQGLLVSIDVGRQMLTVRRVIENSPKQVLHLNIGSMLSATRSTP